MFTSVGLVKITRSKLLPDDLNRINYCTHAPEKKKGDFEQSLNFIGKYDAVNRCV